MLHFTCSCCGPVGAFAVLFLVFLFARATNMSHLEDSILVHLSPAHTIAIRSALRLHIRHSRECAAVYRHRRDSQGLLLYRLFISDAWSSRSALIATKGVLLCIV